MEGTHLPNFLTSIIEIPRAKARLARQKDAGSKPLPGESDKDQEQLNIISFGSQLIDEQLRILGVKGKILKPQQVHFLSDEAYHKLLPKTKTCASYQPDYDAAYVITTNHTKLQNIDRTLEEMIHGSTYQDYKFDRLRRLFVPRRSGYRSRIQGISYYLGLDEGEIELMRYDMLQRHSLALEATFFLSQDEQKNMLKDPKHGYPLYASVVRKITEQIAQEQGLPVDHVTLELQRGLFQEKPDSFILIEKTFEKDGLEILAYLGVIDKALDMKIKDYFFADSLDERQRLGKEILESVPDKFTRRYKELNKN